MIDPNNLDRCFVYPSCDLAYMQSQKAVLLCMLEKCSSDMTPEDIKMMNHLVGFLNHFLYGVYTLRAEYQTANRSVY